METWKAVVGYEGWYEVSDLGRVRSKIKILHNVLRKSGYHFVCLRKEGKQKNCKVARLVAAAFIPNPENKPQVNHKDGVKSNNCATNLEWATNQENMDHAYEHNLIPILRGERHGRSKLSEDNVRQIRLLRETGLTCDALGQQFGVSHRTVEDIIAKRTWQWLA